jgi:uncharacterized membrane protein YjgN (DUF898 family)
METTNTQPGTPSSSREVNRFLFDGKGSELFLLMIVNFILTVFTFGIYKFWGVTRTRKYIWSHLTFAGDRLEYTGTGKELLRSFVKVFVVFFLFGLVTAIVSKFAPFVGLGLRALTSVAVFLLVGYAQYSGRNYRLARTRWRGIRLGMTAGRREYMKAYVIYSILMFFTLGFIGPVRWVKLRAILVGNTRIGTKQLTYTGDAKAIYWSYMWRLILIPFTFGIFWFWYRAWQMRYDYNNTFIGECNFKCVIHGEDLLYAAFAGILMVVFTAGVAAPWALRLWIQTHTESLAVMDRLPLEEIAQDNSPQASALGEEVADFLDVDFGF